MNNNMNKKIEPEKPYILSYLALRRAIGFLGAMLPWVLWLGACLISRTELQDSISSYYYTEMRNVFVGTLCAIGVFLLCYKGYGCADAVASRLGGLFAICTALFPTAPDGIPPTVGEKWIGCIHLIFAALFFITLAYMSLFLFTKTHREQPKISITAYVSIFRSNQKRFDQTRIPGKEKLKRNLVYYSCGVIMLVCILVIGLYYGFFDKNGVSGESSTLVFWLEAAAVFAFGISWLIKGETLLKDKNK